MTEPPTTINGARPLAKFCRDHGFSLSTGYILWREGRLKIRKVGKLSVVTDEDATEFRRNLPLAEAKSESV